MSYLYVMNTNLDLMIIAIINKLFMELMGIISISTSDKMCQIER